MVNSIAMENLSTIIETASNPAGRDTIAIIVGCVIVVVVVTILLTLTVYCRKITARIAQGKFDTTRHTIKELTARGSKTKK